MVYRLLFIGWNVIVNVNVERGSWNEVFTITYCLKLTAYSLQLTAYIDFNSSTICEFLRIFIVSK